MNKNELVEAVQKALGKGVSKSVAENAVSAVLESIAKGVNKDKKVKLIGFGTFEVRKRIPRYGKNPKTGQRITHKYSKSLVFKASKKLLSGDEWPGPKSTHDE